MKDLKKNSPHHALRRAGNSPTFTETVTEASRHAVMKKL